MNIVQMKVFVFLTLKALIIFYFVCQASHFSERWLRNA